MNHLPGRADYRPAPALTRRQAAKLKTRTKLLDAARELFADRGYDAATVRDIAAAANLSTGAVFASFSDKADLFNEVIVADYEHLYRKMTAASEEPTARETLLKLLTLAYDAHLNQLRLVQAALSFSWLRDVQAERRHLQGAKLVLDHLAQVLRRGVNAGEFPAWLDVRLTSEMLWDSYVSNYKRAIFDGWDSQALRARLSNQIDVLLCVRPAAA